MNKNSQIKISWPSLWGLKLFIFIGSFFILEARIFSEQKISYPKIKIAQGFEVRLVASDPLVKYPMLACLDDLGRLYVAESDGRNLTTRAAIERELPVLLGNWLMLMEMVFLTRVLFLQIG